MMQYLPFADAKALAVYDAFERGVINSSTPSGSSLQCRVGSMPTTASLRRDAPAERHQ
jgi:hypothetical protein